MGRALRCRCVGPRRVLHRTAVVLENVEHPRHLREDEDAVALRMEAAEELVEEHHLPRVLDEALVGGERRLLGALEEVRVVGALAQLHQDVEHPRARAALWRGEAEERAERGTAWGRVRRGSGLRVGQCAVAPSVFEARREIAPSSR